MQIDPAATFDRLLRRIASPEAAERIRANALYVGLVDSLPGVTEYMGVEALAEHSKESGLDLIVLDTPPAARGLDFLSAPRRMVDLLEHDALRWFLRGDSLLNRALSGSARGAAAILRLADRALGFGFLSDLVEFFRVFDGLYDGFAGRSRATAEELGHARFVVATSPDTTALQISSSLAQALIEGGKHPSLLINRSASRRMPDLPPPLDRLPALQLPESLVPGAEIPSDLALRMVRPVTPDAAGRSPSRR
jgi:anion-transporting  ArsA/GET3 family ATPase